MATTAYATGARPELRLRPGTSCAGRRIARCNSGGGARTGLISLLSPAGRHSMTDATIIECEDCGEQFDSEVAFTAHHGVWECNHPAKAKLVGRIGKAGLVWCLADNDGDQLPWWTRD